MNFCVALRVWTQWWYEREQQARADDSRRRSFRRSCAPCTPPAARYPLFSIQSKRYPDRASKRALHGTILFFAYISILLGFLIAFVVRQAKGQSQIAAGESASRQAHSYLGYAILGALTVQAASGMYKFVVRTRDGRGVASWHALLGPLVWLAALANVSVGVYILWWPARTGLAIGVWGALGALACSVMLHLFTGPRVHEYNDVDVSDLEDSMRTSSMGSLGTGGLLVQ